MLSIHSIVRRRGWMSAPMLLIVASLLAACGASTSASSPSTPTSQPAATVPQVTITAKDFSFAMPDTLQTGLVDITLTNQGTQPHNAQLERLNNGVTQAQVLAAFTKGPDALLPLLSSYGGASTVDPGQSQEVILNIAQGQYIMLCFVSGLDNIPHFIKGMYKFFTVNGPSNANQVSQPQVNGQDNAEGLQHYPASQHPRGSYDAASDESGVPAARNGPAQALCRQGCAGRVGFPGQASGATSLY